MMKQKPPQRSPRTPRQEPVKAPPRNPRQTGPVAQPGPIQADAGKHPMVPMSPAMVDSIKASPAGVLPAALARRLKNGGK